ncbi:pimeloyl-ACP methyl ester carboxylesterase [Saccharothrix ecbatanensis]|uniref:Pimeloyl-ACP methyl ester carboxylesterase n=1 Tax=Saccharothrix ecbatanensis TaxID=1105145 RepID=A0A7W9M3W6_9PSEU|nr:alpha/beta hydrolase [Saccharothrix ecbatanensis]MBB5806368.1 pimeloyl-ACP methyl ester carboxylesterase [Saccharothrix ecbatanensis]
MQNTLLDAEGVRLAVRESGPVDAPAVVLVHGWAQSGEVWPPDPSYRSYALDLRGHGNSEITEGGYRESAAWAADLRAVLDHVGRPAVLVGWSYGGLVITDYLRAHGTAGVSGLVLVGAITELGKDRPGGVTGRLSKATLADSLSEDPAVAAPALTEFCRDQAPGLPGELVQRLLGTALRVPPRVRREMFERDVESAAVLKSVDKPTLVVHGTADEVVDPAAGEFAAAMIPGADLRRYERTAHSPFLEQPERFAADLAGFVAEVSR